jgi:hypothetical protein
MNRIKKFLDDYIPFYCDHFPYGQAVVVLILCLVFGAILFLCSPECSDVCPAKRSTLTA